MLIKPQSCELPLLWWEEKKKPKKDKEKRESRKKNEKELHAVIGSITDLFNMQIPFEFYFFNQYPLNSRTK